MQSCPVFLFPPPVKISFGALYFSLVGVSHLLIFFPYLCRLAFPSLPFRAFSWYPPADFFYTPTPPFTGRPFFVPLDSSAMNIFRWASLPFPPSMHHLIPRWFSTGLTSPPCFPPRGFSIPSPCFPPPFFVVCHWLLEMHTVYSRTEICSDLSLRNLVFSSSVD